jgi:prefoldin subunit 5
MRSRLYNTESSYQYLRQQVLGLQTEVRQLHQTIQLLESRINALEEIEE